VYAGYLTGKWIVKDDWVFESFSAGKFLEEEGFGLRKEVENLPLGKTAFYLHSSFTNNNADRVKLAQELIHLAGGELLDVDSKRQVKWRIYSFFKYLWFFFKISSPALSSFGVSRARKEQAFRYNVDGSAAADFPAQF
jgi:hypothetical protein